MKQIYSNYTEQNQSVWKTLFRRQRNNLADKAAKDYLCGLDLLRPVLNENKIPNFNELNKHLLSLTGWQIEVVPGLIPVEEFFELLSQRKFCSSTWLRSADQLDYLEEPDMFHDIFGHVPLLAIPEYAEFMESFGQTGVKIIDDPVLIRELQRLYWFTIEFGLVKEDRELKVYGAGIASSFGETNHALDPMNKELIPFDIMQVMKTEFHTDEIQEKYFLLENMNDLFRAFMECRKTLEMRGVGAGVL